MNQLLAGGFALTLTLILWGLGKKSNQRFKGIYTKTSFVRNGENQISLLRNEQKIQASCSKKEADEWNPPKTNFERIKLRKTLFKLMQSTPEDRIYAIQIAMKWGDDCILPIIRKGLRDSESEIMILAAKGIEKFKKNSFRKTDHSKESLPLNIFLMR